MKSTCRRTLKVILGLALSIVFQPVGAQTASVLFGIGSGAGDGSSDLYQIESFASKPTAVKIGETGHQVLDIAMTPAGTLFATTGSVLYSVNTLTGGLTGLGAQGASGINALEAYSDTTLLGWGRTNTNLYTINTVTGTATVAFDTGFMSAGDLALSTDHHTLYGTTTTNQLIRMDLNTKRVAVVGNLNAANIYGLAFGADGNLYGGQGSSGGNAANLYRIDTRTGSASLIDAINGANGYSGFGMYGLSGMPAAGPAPVPEMSTVIGMLCLVGGGCLLLRRQLRPTT